VLQGRDLVRLGLGARPNGGRRRVRSLQQADLLLGELQFERGNGIAEVMGLGRTDDRGVAGDPRWTRGVRRRMIREN
jgi:hypothetical protein